MSKTNKKSSKKKLTKKKKTTVRKKVNPIMVSIVTVTYNQKEYIKECLDSLVCQKTNFRFQILVGDDCSTDGTTDIVRQYAKRYPGLIVPVLRRKNVGSMRNFGDLCERAVAASPFVAFCDGDDYWTDENKLQYQYDYLVAHPDLGGCFCNVLMTLPKNHFLETYYKRAKDGNIYMPECIPEFKKSKHNYYDVKTFMECGGNPTPLAVMLRVNQNLNPLPDWFYRNKYIGDLPMFLLHMGRRGMVYLEDKVMAVYRKNDNSLTTYKSMDENFLYTRPQYLIMLTGLRQFFIRWYGGYGVVQIENRIKYEASLYLQVLVKNNMKKEIADFFRTFPDAGVISLNAYLSFYNDSRRMTRIYGWEGNKIVARNSKFMHLFKPIVKLYTRLSLTKAKIKKFISRLKKCKFSRKVYNFSKFIAYWLNCLIPKSKKRWAFTSFYAGNKFFDNAKYYYEYVVKNHPEIKAIWFTKSKELYKKLKANGYPVSMNNTIAGAWRMARCSVAVTDHFKMTDYNPLHGLSDRTKIVQLWHGVGLKSMGNGKEVKNTDVAGVMYSTDIIAQPGDSAGTRFIKKIKYFRHAYFRELFEKYFLFVCPGQERIDMFGKRWNIPESSYFMAGHPRNLPVYNSLSLPSKNYVIYAPTYRMKEEDEKSLVKNFLDSVSMIQETMEKYDSVFVLRLHPNTWRNYSKLIKPVIKKYNRIKFDDEKDIYPRINDYAVIISDYSSIAYDFLLFDKAAVFFCYDYETFCKNDTDMNLDYMEATPGPKTYTWEETMEEVGKYLEDPQKDAGWRKEVLKYFFDETANGPDNSERITQEIKRRLKMKK
ncbi:MAG: CDP-glycerol glycerophosphotransferase family protein [Eubacteriales bacterium]